MTSMIPDGTIIERHPGVYYQWVEKQNSWIRLNGYKSIKYATQSKSGLMKKEDYQKLQGLLTVPPKTTLTSNQCNTTFESGSIKLYSRDFSLFIEDFLDLYEKGQTIREQWKIHEDTCGFNFRVNLNYLVEEMKSRGNLISETLAGPKGIEGDRGDPGINQLDTGPKGPDGEDGINAPFAGTLINNSGFNLKDKSRVVVDIGTEKISQDENYLVVYKGVSSPTNLCTRYVNTNNRLSSWVVVRDEQGILCTNECVPAECNVHAVYVDIDIITDSLKARLNQLIAAAKANYESMVREWLRTLMKIFNDQKYALCCALENCRSRKRNSDERRYIESQRIAAAAADFNLIISGSRDPESVPEDHTKVALDMDKFKECIGPGWQPTIVEEIEPPNGEIYW